ncbi:MAG: hypothetical protein PVH62_07240 [Anaerolineae bacterium]
MTTALARAPTEPSHAGRWLPPVLLLIVTLSLYLAFRSISLDDFDSYSFALALDHFSLDLQQPQPPGFPVYVFLGRLLLPYAGEPTTALTLLSAFSGALIVFLVYKLGQALSSNGFLAGVGAALLVGLTPMGWLTAEKALSDAPGLALTLLSIWLLWLGRDDLRRLSLGAFAFALSLGLRPQDGLPALLLLAGLTVRYLLERRSLYPLVWASLPFLAGLVVWLLPILRSAGGLGAYLAHLSAHSAHVRQTDSLLALGLGFPAALRARALAFGNTFFLHTIGTSPFSNWGWKDAARGLALALVAVPGLAKAGWRRRDTWLLAGWAAVVGSQIFLFETLDRPRLMIPLLPPLALLIARGWARLRYPRLLPATALTLTVFALLLQGVPLAAQLASAPAPSVQAAAHVAAHYPSEETLVAAAGSFRSVQVELPSYRLLYLYEFDASAVESEELRYIAIFDRDKFPDEAVAALSGDGRYVPLEDQSFVRDPRVHTQSDRIRLQVLTPADLLPPEALALPKGGCIDLGSPDDGRFIDRGWYGPEDIGGVRGRWAGGILTTTVRLYLERGRDYHLYLRALPYPSDQEVVLRLGDEPIVRLPLQPTWADYAASIPGSLLPQEGVALLELVHTRMTSPFAETGGGSSDSRALTAAYDWICLSVDSTPERRSSLAAVSIR